LEAWKRLGGWKKLDSCAATQLPERRSLCSCNRFRRQIHRCLGLGGRWCHLEQSMKMLRGNEQQVESPGWVMLVTLRPSLVLSMALLIDRLSCGWCFLVESLSGVPYSSLFFFQLLDSLRSFRSFFSPSFVAPVLRGLVQRAFPSCCSRLSWTSSSSPPASLVFVRALYRRHGVLMSRVKANNQTINPKDNNTLSRCSILNTATSLVSNTGE
jgi:hypothetical protein